MKYRNDLKKRILAGLLAGAALCLAAPAAQAAGSPVPNGTLPDGGHFVAGGNDANIVTNQAANRTDITQSGANAVIKWDSFNVGANATVNFGKEGGGKFNTLNYVNSANGLSQIYGTINAQGGNIYIVNPAGVEIGNSAQINVGSLYVSNKYLDDALKDINTENPDIPTIIKAGITQDTILMSLGNVNANNVTFDGNRIVIDTERLKDAGGDAKLIDVENGLTIRTTNADNVVIGYDAYDEDTGYTEAETKNFAIKEIKKDESGNVTESAKEVAGYMWVEDVEQLQAIGASEDTLDGNYALRNSIDATATKDWNDGAGFASLGTTEAFNGKFDGLDYNIFNLNINRAAENNVGLFGMVGSGAVINNVTLVGGSITGKNNVGALAGSVQGGAHISNVTNSASVTGASNVGGIVGASIGTDENHTVYDGLINTGTIISSGTDDGKGGTVSNAGGLIGYLEEGELGGASYNLGAVKGQTDESGNMTVGYNVGGLVGHAVDSVIGNKDTIDEDGNVIAEGATVYNRLNVTGKYNVGGIVGNMEGSTVQNAENSGNVTATGFTTGDYEYHSAHYANNEIYKVEGVYLANVGGIAGSASATQGHESLISGALNTGEVSSGTAEESGYTYYTAGNVGGVVGSAVDTDITNATNRENNIRGAHNVGGIAGYFSGSGTVTNGINDGSDIMATGARNASGFVRECVRAGNAGGEEAIIGNMGGIVGYLYGDDVYITGSANRGTVHSQDITGNTVQPVSQAANAGGIVGKIDRDETKTMDAVKGDVTVAAVSNSYNTGDVRGYMGVGGIAGMMYNGEIAGSYNLGNINTTRNAASFVGSSYYSVNMGGIVGDTTEVTQASALLYDVYNKGQIGDETFNYYARHVGGIVGRLSGTVEKAYNTGAIYNGYIVVGGIAGWMYKGSITDAFNTGNITVINNDRNNSSSQVGGIVGAASTEGSKITLTNVYNLGTLRSFEGTSTGKNTVGGILGIINQSGKYEVSIKNAYTTGNIWAGTKNADGTYSEDTANTIRSIWGASEVTGGEHRSVETENTYYIRPDETLKDTFTDLSTSTNNRDNSNKAIDFDKKDNIVNGQYENQYTYTDETGTHSLGFSTQNGGDVVIEDGKDWRIYKGSTPILNAFLPNAEDYFDQYTDDVSLNGAGIGSIQYGTAYDPLLTIINAAKDTASLTFNWQDLGINNDAGLAVYGAGLTLNDFMSTGGSGYFGGLIYSDGALNINAHTSGETHDAANTNVTGNVALGSASQIYGSSVTIDADGQVTIYGSVTATGNTQDGTSWDETQKKYTGTIDATDGSISITGGNVDVYGQLTSAKDKESVRVPGINGMAEGWNPAEHGNVADPNAKMSDIGDRFGYTTGASAVNGNISITANDTEDGHVNVYYGNKGEGIVTTGGNLTVTASGDIYMDSDLSIGGDLSLNAGQITNPDGTTSTAEGSEAVLDISNIGKVQAENGVVQSAKEGLHNFLDHFAQDGKITLGGDETKIAVDMWGGDSFNLQKYDLSDEEKDTLAYKLNQLNINGEKGKGKEYTYIWVSTGEQLAGIQQYYEQETNAGRKTNILSYNFALKNDIDASNVRGYEAIGTGSAYTGTFDGRDNRIIGLTMTGDNAGLFDTIGADGTVEDLRVYSGTFSGKTNAGAVAGVNNGKISNVTAFGNVVEVLGNEGTAGGIVGTNSTTNAENIAVINNVTAIGAVTVGEGDSASGVEAVAGGVAGYNGENSEIRGSSSNSAVNASAGNATALGGVVGLNEGTLDNVDSLGVTTGIYRGDETKYSHHVGGITGSNHGTVNNAYNESIVSGDNNVGGIIGANSGTVFNVANASSVTGEGDANAEQDEDKISHYVGGLAGSNSGTITNGRNNGEITGNNYVGGLVGDNAAGSELKNLVNDSAAAITGDNYVGGIAGSNAGIISADEDNDNLINRGTIIGQQYVGGVAGVNTGTITNTNNDVTLNVKDPNKDAQYFGGVVGVNGHYDEDTGKVTAGGTIIDATNRADINAEDADYVGGIVGWNTSEGVLQGMGNSNEGDVTGNNYVGGVAGKNDAAVGSATGKQVVITNSGTVTAIGGGAGGIFGENDGVISNVHLTNEGNVTGTTTDTEGDKTGTGGIFGINHKDITNSILENLTGDVTINTDNGQSAQNVGGLMGINTGDVSTSSLKNEADITVTAGKGQTVTNIGGLIGQNSGTIIGGQDANDSGYYKYQIYNNGTITVKGDGSNIGGLVGSNQKKTDGTGGTITAGYNTGAIEASGSTNVGGIAGTNEGTLDQVFNTVITGVNEDGSTASGSITGSTNVGGIAGTNEANAEISNAYNTTEVSGGASIAGTNNGTIDNVYSTTGTKLVDEGNAATHVYDRENGFGTGGSSIHKDGEEVAKDDLWRQYGDNNPILKVFLTQLTVNETAEINGQTVKLNDYLNLVYNGKEQDINIQDLIDKGFITGPDGMKDEDGNSFVFHAYENTLKGGDNAFNDSDVLYNTTGQVHANENGDSYSWLASSQIAGGKEDGVFTPNNLGYDIQMNNSPTLHRAQISITLDDVNRTYGDKAFTNDTSYDYDISIANGNKELNDGMKDELAGAIIFTQKSDGAVDGFTGDKQTNSANKENENYTWTAEFGFTDNSTLTGDYTFVTGENQTGNTVTVSGNSHVDRAELTIEAEDKQIHVGSTPNYTGTVDHFVNGDSFDVKFGMSADHSHLENEVGTYQGFIGFWYDNQFYTSGTQGLQDLFGGNYNVTFKPGTLTVLALPDGMPDIPEIPGIENHWNGLLGDNPWDRNRDFRERKAEIHYIAGGMTL